LGAALKRFEEAWIAADFPLEPDDFARLMAAAAQ
jgi:hypothetical protein